MQVHASDEILVTFNSEIRFPSDGILMIFINECSVQSNDGMLMTFSSDTSFHTSDT